MHVCVCVCVTISGCQLQFCGPEENTVDSLRVLLVPLIQMCWPATVSVSVCVCVCVLVLQETKLTPQGLDFLIGLVLIEFWFQFLQYNTKIDFNLGCHKQTFVVLSFTFEYSLGLHSLMHV